MSIPDELSILIADDDATNRDILSQALQRLAPNATVTIAMNGEQAIDAAKAYLESNQRNFDVIFMDYQMPLINGQEATTSIRESEKALNIDPELVANIITWSAARSTPYDGADNAMSKPLEESELTTIIELVSQCKK